MSATAKSAKSADRKESKLKKFKRNESKHAGSRRKELDATEVADAAMTAALVIALLAAGRVLAAGSVFQVVASFVVAVLAARRRTRVVVISTAAAASIAIILGGLGPVTQAALAGVFGWAGGQGLKHGWGRTRSVAFTILIAWPAMAASVLFVFPAVAINKKLRKLLFENIENQAEGFSNMLGAVGSAFDSIGLGVLDDVFNSLGDALIRISEFLIDHWLLLIPTTELIYSFMYALMIRGVGGAMLRRLDKSLIEPITLTLQPDDSPEPTPVSLHNAVLERNGVAVTQPIELTVSPGEHVVVEGQNGAGKSTLLDALAGLDNHERIERAGSVGLGSPRGTARVGQRPEAQVVGTTVDEDLRWGLDTPDFDAVTTLADVGLAIPGDRPTSELSGGELQRLALASALRREPQLILLDEVTSMLDPAEQQRITSRLNDLTGTTVVRTTHREDASPADRVVRLEALAQNAHHQSRLAGVAPGEIALHTIQSDVNESRLLRLQNVGFAHNIGQPWELPVLDDITLSIHRYSMVIVEGSNGSGKTTLARILAGVTDPTTGEVHKAKGVRRALAHQHVRLQLLRPTVDIELRSLAGVRTERPDPKKAKKSKGKKAKNNRTEDNRTKDSKAKDSEETSDDARQRMRSKNLETSIELFDLSSLLRRRIDELSGGEQRRVLLAGLVARGVSLLVLDEPLAGLDRSGRADLATTLDHVRLAGTSIVVVSHDIEWAPSHVDQRLKLDDGRLKQMAL